MHTKRARLRVAMLTAGLKAVRMSSVLPAVLILVCFAWLALRAWLNGKFPSRLTGLAWLSCNHKVDFLQIEIATNQASPVHGMSPLVLQQLSKIRSFLDLYFHKVIY